MQSAGIVGETLLLDYFSIQSGGIRTCPSLNHHVPRVSRATRNIFVLQQVSV